MDIDVQVAARIGAPIAKVSAFACEPVNAPAWYRRIHSAEWVTEPPLQVGSRFAFVARFLGRELRYTYEVTEWLPGETLVMRTAQGPFPMRTTYTWRPDGSDATIMTLRNDGQPTGFASIGAPVMRGAMKRAMTQDLAALDELLR